MMKTRFAVSVLPIVLCLAAAAHGGRLSFEEHAAVQESLSRVHPRTRASWLRAHGLDDSYYTTFHRPESTGLRCIGRWPWGPSWELAGRDTFLYLGSGSGVRILSIADSVQPRMLGQINARSLVSQVVVQDSLLFVACGSWGAQIYSVANPANPRELGSMDAVISDVCVKDTFCYAVGSAGLRIYNVASASDPRLVGAVQDSGDLVVVANGHAFSAGRSVMNIYNVTDPAHPMWVNSRGGSCYAMAVRRNLLLCSSVQPDNMTILNISNPLSITQVSQVSGYGGDGLFLDDSYAYLTCDYEHSGLFVIDVSDSSHPALRDSIDPEGVTEWEPYVPRPNSYGYLADDYGGLITLDLHDVNSIAQEWAGYGASMAADVFVDGTRAYVADTRAGLRIIDVQDPSFPQTLGEYEGIGPLDNRSAVARDSFAFITWWGDNRRFMRVLDVTDPSLPAFAAEESCKNPPEDYVLRDSFLYAAEEYLFQIFNVARPREPARMGSCALPGSPGKLILRDSTAYAATFGVQCLSIDNPDSPSVVGVYGTEVVGLDIADSIIYGAGPYTGIISLSVANPAAPYLLDSLNLTDTLWWTDVVVADSLAYVGGERVWGIDVSDPRDMRLVPQVSWTPPYLVSRLLLASPYLYAACYDAGVCVLETLPVGIEEEHTEKGGATREWSVSPSVTAGSVVITAASTTARVALSLYNAGGFRVGEKQTCLRWDETGLRCSLDLSALPDGVYFVKLHGDERSFTAKVVKTKGR